MAKRQRWPGFGDRVRQRLLALGYVRPDGQAHISRFTTEKGYVITLFYKYLDNTTPDRENLLRLARDLQVSPAWLLFGDDLGSPAIAAAPAPAPARPGKRRRMTPIAGGSDAPVTPFSPDIIRELGRFVFFLRDLHGVAYRTLRGGLAWILHPPLVAA